MVCKMAPRALGEKLGNFEVRRIVPIEELQCELIELEHLPTGASVMHIAADDPENLFCLSLKTLPDSSNGVAHILEHTVLCGSEKFPVRDPFFSMNRRSLNTFMNALTGSDFTCYPASTMVKKDFYNLLDVYIDAVFHPKLHELSFRQEGHRLEYSKEGDVSSPLKFAGVVFNEMKGSLSAPSRRQWEELGKRLFPDVTYGVNSGGEPTDIPSLTYQQLKDFHATYYHPSRCLFFFYGDLPLEEHLEFLETHALKGVKKLPALPPVPRQPRFKAPVRAEATFPMAEDEDTTDKGLFALGWLTAPIEDQTTLLTLSVLDLLLTGTDAAPLKMALLRSGLCKSANLVMDEEIREVPVVVLAKDCNPENADKLEKLIRDTLEHCAKDGFAERRIEAALHQLELDRSEIGGDNNPFGLTLFMRAALLRQHGVQPEKGLMIHALFEEARKLCAQRDYLPGLIRTYLLDNPHCVRLMMRPDKAQAAREKRAEEEKLEQIRNSLSLQESKALVDQAVALSEFQAEQEDEDIDVLPTVTLEDVPVEGLRYPLDKRQPSGIPTFHHTCFTNRLILVDLVFDLPKISEEELMDTRLFSLLLSNIGAGTRSYVDVLEYQEEHTGGVSCSLSLNPQAESPDAFRPAFQIKGKMIRRKADKLIPLLREMICAPNFHDKARIKELLTKHYSGLHSSILGSPLSYATSLSGSGLNVVSRVSEGWFGLEYYHKVKELVENFDREIGKLIERFDGLRKRLLTPHNLQIVTNCDEESYQAFVPSLEQLRDLPQYKFEPWVNQFTLKPVETQARIIASPVAFTGKVIPTICYSHPDSPLLGIAAFLMDNRTLHRRIREKGGAYGGGCNPNPVSGKFTFHSYRDPHIAATLQAFDMAVRELIDGKFSKQDLEEAKLEVIQQLDSPVAPGSRAITEYGWIRAARSFEVRQAFRQRLLAATPREVRDAVEKHILPNMDKGAAVSFASQELIDKENKRLEKAGKAPMTVLPV